MPSFVLIDPVVLEPIKKMKVTSLTSGEEHENMKKLRQQCCCRRQTTDKFLIRETHLSLSSGELKISCIIKMIFSILPLTKNTASHYTCTKLCVNINPFAHRNHDMKTHPLIIIIAMNMK